MGSTWYELGNGREALECFGQSLALFRALGLSGDEARVLEKLFGVFSDLSGTLELHELERVVALMENAGYAEIGRYRDVLDRIRNENGRTV